MLKSVQRPEDLIVNNGHDIAGGHLKAQGVLKTLAIDALLEMVHLDHGSLIIGEIVRLKSSQNLLVAIKVGHKDDLLGVVVQPGPETRLEDPGRV